MARCSRPSAARRRSSADCADALLARLGRAGILATPEPDGTALIASSARDSISAAHAIRVLASDGVVMTITFEERDALLRQTSHSPSAASYVVKALGVNGLAHLTDEHRATLIASAACDSITAARAAIAIGVDLIEAAIGADLIEAERARLRAALLEPDAATHVAHALSEGALWSPWMQDYAPSDQATADVFAAWRVIIDLLPPAVAEEIIAREFA